MDEMAHFDRERIPERVVHAKGAGMFVPVHICTHAYTTKNMLACVFVYMILLLIVGLCFIIC